MRLLLDTHAFLWWATGNAKLPPSAGAAINSADNELFISSVIAWEIMIKAGTGALILPTPARELIDRPLAHGDAAELPVKLTHALRVGELPKHHKDPFDRLLIAQAMIEGLTILTLDGLIKQYGVDTFW